MIRASVAAFLMMSARWLSAQGPVTNRMAPTTLRGTIVEVTCFRQQGAATVSTPEQIAVRKSVWPKVAGWASLPRATDCFRSPAAFPRNKFAKLAPFIGQRVDMSGAEVVISNNYDYKSFDAEKVTRVK